MACNIGECIRYACTEPQGPIDGAVYTPYVKLTFAEKQIITIGNKSAPNANLACVSNFTFGWTPNANGFGMTIEIIDNGGALYKEIVKAMNKTAALVTQDMSTIKADYGWIVTNCDGSSRLVSAETLKGYTPHGIIYGMDASFETGNVKIKFEVRGIPGKVPEVAHAGATAGEDQKVTLKDALRRLFTEKHPQFKGVEFRDKDGGNNFKFSTADGSSGDGPKATWPYEQQNTLTTARMWLSSVLTDNDLGCLLIYDNKRDFIVVQEDPSGAKQPKCEKVKGTFVINGGNCSNVISFTPKVNFNFGSTAGAGGAGSGASSGDASQQVEPTIDAQQAGVQKTVAIQQHEWQFRSPESHANKALIGNEKQLDAARAAGEGTTRQPIDVELKIHGDPQYSNPLEYVDKYFSIVFINPFYLGEGCTWLQTSKCNSMLSNRHYKILGICHQIQNGSYTTTFNLKLFVPNIDIDYDSPLGGDGSETFVDGLNGFGKSLPLDATQNS